MTTPDIIKELRKVSVRVMKIEREVDDDGYTDEEADVLQESAVYLAELFQSLDVLVKIDEAPTK